MAVAALAESHPERGSFATESKDLRRESSRSLSKWTLESPLDAGCWITAVQNRSPPEISHLTTRGLRVGFWHIRLPVSRFRVRIRITASATFGSDSVQRQGTGDSEQGQRSVFSDGEQRQQSGVHAAKWPPPGRSTEGVAGGRLMADPANRSLTPSAVPRPCRWR